MEKTSRRHRRVRRSLRRPAAAALLALAAVTAGCSSGTGPSVASGGGGNTPSSTQTPSILAYAHCMIAHGITNFPEPDSSGQLKVSAGGAGMPDVNSPQFQAAAKACGSLNPAGVAESPAEKAKRQQAAVAYAKCMRSHGIPNFPDPTSTGTFDVGGLDMNSPQIQTADKACATNGVSVFGGRAG